jgi:hypothetical protein
MGSQANNVCQESWLFWHWPAVMSEVTRAAIIVLYSPGLKSYFSLSLDNSKATDSYRLADQGPVLICQSRSINDLSGCTFQLV